MKLIDSDVQLVPQEYTLDGVYKHIELIGRVCTKSEDRITPTSAEKFVEKLKNLHHRSPLEHATIYLTVPLRIDGKTNPDVSSLWSFFNEDPYSWCSGDRNNAYITTNYRVIVEHKRYTYLKYLTEPNYEYHNRRITVKFTCSRAVANEFVRHRVFSFMQESTRYVNYKDGIEFIKPEWYNDSDTKQSLKDEFAQMLKSTEDGYKQLISDGQKAQQARDILPLATKTELYMTGTIDQWEHFLSLRSPSHGAQGVHPDAAKLADIVDHQLNFTNEQ